MPPLLLKGGLHGSCLRPWSFVDSKLEARFQEYRFLTLVDRARPVMSVLIPFGWISRLIFLVVRLIYPFEWTPLGVLVYAVRLITWAGFTATFAVDWSTVTKANLGYMCVWINRIGFLLAIAVQSGIEQEDSAFMTLPTLFMIISGVMMPSFEEYVATSAIVNFVRPIDIVLFSSNGCPRGASSPCPGRDLNSVAVHGAALLFIFVGIYYHVFSDSRRLWLLSYEVFGTLADSAAVLPDPSHPSAAQQPPPAGAGAPARRRCPARPAARPTAGQQTEEWGHAGSGAQHMRQWKHHAPAAARRE